MKRILIIIGTRPEAIKLCPLVLELKKRELFITEVLLTGQHTDMVYPITELFGVRYDYDMKIMKNSQTLSFVGAKLLESFENFFSSHSYDAVIVQGDTSSAYFGALSAFYHNIKVVHIEAGLRSHDIYSPFPEEINRRSLAMLAYLSFAPNEYAEKNLRAEGVADNVFVVGNTVTDSLFYTLDTEYENAYTHRRYVLITIHRRENHGRYMYDIFRGIRKAALGYPDIDFIFPVHRSPYVRSPASEVLSGIENVIMTDPLSPYDFHNLLYRSVCAVSDSGGVQEEACALGVPLIVPRENTEREAELASGGITLCERSEDGILSALRAYLNGTDMGKRSYKKTCVCKKIADIMTFKL